MENAAIYDAEWRRLRRRFLGAHPRCPCGAPATDVDHVQSVRSHPQRRLDWSNLRALCHSCHSRRTALEQGGWSKQFAGGALPTGGEG